VLFCVHDSQVTRQKLAEILSDLADALAATGHIVISGQALHLPGTLLFDLKYERTPHGNLAVDLRAEWPGAGVAQPRIIDSEGLVIAAADQTNAQEEAASA
jgi:hypothetical protein